MHDTIPIIIFYEIIDTISDTDAFIVGIYGYNSVNSKHIFKLHKELGAVVVHYQNRDWQMQLCH